ncbi:MULTISPECIES: helix-turn-helix transcriptional regulator [unclassified Paenibacillus]|uniref:helix-turn-helix domain-containing protein n=1 Tax=unclassified Paenibacillus TaxID=185978 RepID=UPI000CFD81C8|nr:MULTISPECIES: helix-turn-helix transcriptional regulator [unclassified Paenibacillus]MBD8841175.1 helix-turn-helix transcriptional regulator [Paenibacillus sp. CFBP 13594]PRA01780.1 transcriptional regulator [Paenibacillus sp. MYb63]PRA44474.1 transcriptional regulator [Paenibacillus sp. MYb67]QZN77471.1 helix-turn-helix transcriptional regulator [Paenibacillus sp. DR312]
MEPTTTIRSYIEDYIRKQGYTLQYFADISGVNAGTLSAIIKGTRPIAMAQLDLITQGMKLEEGYFYEIYGAECFVESAPHWRRLEPFLQRCAELDKLECIHKVIQEVTDDRSYISELFEMAEGMLERGQTKAARMLYECVAECEKYQHSERLALCQYRIFTLSLGQDQHENLRAAVHFEPYINRLDEERQLDAIRELANTYNGLCQWDKVFQLADELLQRVKFLEQYKNKKKGLEFIRASKHPLFTYKFYAYLLIATVWGERKEYEKALEYTSFYSNIVIEDSTTEDQLFIKRFKDWAEVNTYLYKLMTGDYNALNSYLDFIEVNENETLLGLVKVMEAANQYQLNVDHVLKRFDSFIRMLVNDSNYESSYTTQIKDDRYTKFWAELAFYQLSKARHNEGFRDLLTCLSSAHKIKDDSTIIYCVSLFEEYRTQASDSIESQYKSIIKEVYGRYEKKSNVGINAV